MLSTDGKSEYNRNLTMEFLASWDGLLSGNHRVMVLGATNRPQNLDEALLRRMPRRLLVDLPSYADRMEILRVVLKDEYIDNTFDYDTLTEMTEGYSGSDIKNLCMAASYIPLRELLAMEKRGDVKGYSDMRPLKLSDFQAAKGAITASVAKNSSASKMLQQWHAKYGDGGSRRAVTAGF
jgi:SpoVK/Ycf46/Vps4 family AAA+-type ATPase